MNIDIADVAGKMLEAAKGVVGQQWPATREYFQSETNLFAQRLASIAKMKADGVISEARAASMLEFQKNAWDTVLLAVAGLNQLMVEQALNAALKAVQTIVNTAVGFALL